MANISHIWFECRIQSLHLKNAKVSDSNAHGLCKYWFSYAWKTHYGGEDIANQTQHEDLDLAPITS